MSDFKLTHRKIDPGWSPPDHYFDSLPDQILKKIDENPRSIWQGYRTIIYASAAVLVIAFGIFRFTKSDDSIDSVSIESYLISQQAVPEDEIIAQFDEADIDALAPELRWDTSEIEDALPHHVTPLVEQP